MDAGSDHGLAAKGSAIDMEIVGSGPVSCIFHFLFFPYLSFLCISMVHRPSPLAIAGLCVGKVGYIYGLMHGLSVENIVTAGLINNQTGAMEDGTPFVDIEDVCHSYELQHC